MTYQTSPIFRRMTLAFLRVETSTAEPGKPGFPPAIGLAVSACESSWWASVTGTNNYFGITRAPESVSDPQSAWCWTTERVTPAQLATFRLDERATAVPIAPGWYKIRRWFAAYSTLEAAVAAYVALLTDNSRYRPSWLAFHEVGPHQGDSAELLRGITAAGYSTGPALKVELEISEQQNVIAAVISGRAELAANPNAS